MLSGKTAAAFLLTLLSCGQRLLISFPPAVSSDRVTSFSNGFFYKMRHSAVMMCEIQTWCSMRCRLQTCSGISVQVSSFLQQMILLNFIQLWSITQICSFRFKKPTVFSSSSCLTGYSWLSYPSLLSTELYPMFLIISIVETILILSSIILVSTSSF